MRSTIIICAALAVLLVASSSVDAKGLGGNLGVKNCPVKTFLPVTVPESFDARQTWPNCVSPIRNQGDCGGCWAVSAAGVLSDRFCIASNGTIRKELSPQQMIDCDQLCQYPAIHENCNAGCEGGYLDNAWDYFQLYGVVGEACVGYVDEDETCPATCGSGANISSQALFKSGPCYQIANVQDAQIEIMTNGPIQAGFTVYENFENYKKGVYTETSGSALGGHAVRIIGWGVDNGVDYWIVANSWTTHWGQDGYFWIERGVNLAGIESDMIAGMPMVNQINATGGQEYENWDVYTNCCSDASTVVMSMGLLVASLLMLL